MADDARQEFVIDASEALNVMGQLQNEFLNYNKALGTIIEANRRLNQTSGQVITTFTQVDEAGRKVITTLEGDARAYRVLATAVGTASAAQRKYAVDIQETIAQNNALAQSVLNASKAFPQLQIGGKPLGQLPFIPPKSAIPIPPSFIGFPGGPGGASFLTSVPGGPPRFPPNITGFPGGPGGSFPGRGGVPGGPLALQPPNLKQLISQFPGIITQAERLNSVGLKIKGTFDLIGRVTAIQLLHRAVVGLIYAIEDGAHASAEFYRQVALVQTLSQNSGESFDKWAGEIKKVADEFGKPATEVAQAAYQGLSNQVINSTSDFELLRRAIEFSRVTNSTATDSIDLFSSAINSFDLTVRDSEKIARTFFTTIDIGRVTADELANTFGRVGPLAKLLGVNFEETNASISALSLAGTRGNDAITLLTNVIRTLIKPGEELKKVLHDAGFESGQAAIQALGFTGTLELLKKEIDGNAETLGKLFPELRGLKGAAILAGEGFDTFKRAIKEATEGTANYENAVRLVNENTGQRFQDQLQRIANFFTVDIGGKFLNNIINVSDKFGGIVEIVKKLTGVAGQAAIVLGSMFIATKITAFLGYLADGIILFGRLIAVVTAGKAALLGFGAVGTTVMAGLTLGLSVLVGYFAMVALDSARSAAEMKSSYDEAFNSLQKEADNFTKSLNKGADEQQTAFEKSLNSQTQAFFKFSAAVQRGLNDIVESSVEAGKRMSESLQDAFEILGGTLKKNINDLEDQERRAENNIKSLQKSQIENKRQAERALFERRFDFLKDRFGRTGQGADAISALVKSRSDLLAKEGAKLFKTGNIEEAERTFDESIRVLEQLNAGRRFQYDTEGLINQRYQERLALENKELSNQQKLLESARQRAQEERANFKQIQDLFERLQKFSVIDKKGKLLPDFKSPQDALEKLNALQNQLLDKLGGVKISDKLTLAKDFAEQQNRVKDLLSGQTQLAQLDGSIVSIQKHISGLNTQFNEFAEKGKQANASLIGVLKNNNEAIARTKQEVESLYKTYIESGQRAVSSNPIKKLQIPILNALGDPLKKFRDLNVKTFESLQNVTPENANLAINQVLKLKDELNKISQSGISGIGVRRGLANAPGSFDEQTQQVRSLSQTLDAVIEKLQKIKGLGNFNIQTQADITRNAENTNQGLARLTEEIQILVPSSQALKTELEGVGETAGGINNVSTSVGNVTNSLNAAIQQAQRLKQALSEIPSTNGAVQGKMFGGPLYYAGGGYVPHGTDIIPAMLSPNEFVVQNPYSQQFRPLLQAINEGRGNSYISTQSRSVSVGDIHINVQGGQTSTRSLTEIGRGLQRAVRSGTLRLH